MRNKKILRLIANTIVANLANTESIGLFDGKMGLCLFLYKYARLSGSGIYEDIASDLLDDIFAKLKPRMSPSTMDGLAGMGYGLAMLLREGLIESDPDENVLQDIDEALLRNIKQPFMQEISFPVPLYSSGIYLLCRHPYPDKETEKTWTSLVIKNAIDFFTQGVSQGRYEPKLSLLNSMLFVARHLLERMPTDKENIEQWIKDVLDLSVQAIQNKNYQEIDWLLLQQNITLLPDGLKTEKKFVITQIEQADCFPDGDALDFWYDNLWWSILYDMPILKDITPEKMQSYLTHRIQESYFDDLTVNSKLSAVGLWLMAKTK